MSALIVVPARGGSKGLPGKNLRTVCGVSLTAHAVRVGRAALASFLPAGSRLVVDTDDPQIAEEGRRWGAEVPFLRAPELAADTSTTVETVLGLLDRLQAARGSTFTSLVLLQPTSPLRSIDDVRASWVLHERSSGAPVTTVAEPSHPPVKSLRVHGGALTWAFGTPPPRRQDAAPVVVETGSVYVLRTRDLACHQAFVVDGLSLPVVCPPSRSLDVDTEMDLALAEVVYRQRALRVPVQRASDAPRRLVRTSELAAGDVPQAWDRVVVEVDTGLHEAVPLLDRLGPPLGAVMTRPPSPKVGGEGVRALRDLASLTGTSPCWSLPAEDVVAQAVLRSHGCASMVRSHDLQESS